MSEFNRYSEAECVAVFGRLFPQGFSGQDVLGELALDGWQRSPLVAVFHPSAEQMYDEARQMHENIHSLRRADDDAAAPPPPSLDEMRAEFRPTVSEPDREVRELVGMCVWDIFSDNHEVVDADGRVVDLGSFRASAGFIADWLNDRIGHEQYDYLHFYLGTIWVSRRADLTPVYQMVFRRLKAAQFDWVYHFPRLQLIDLRPLREALNEQADVDRQLPEWANYDPSQSLVDQQQDDERQQQLAETHASLDEAYREAVDVARHAPPPITVAAYLSMFGRFPRGWPPQVDEPIS